MHARDGAERGASFGFGAFTHDIFARVVFEWNGGEPALLRAVVHEAVFADVEKAPSCWTVPLIRERANRVALETIEMRKRKQTAAESENAIVDACLQSTQRLELTAAVVQDANSTVESELACSRSDLISVFRVPNLASQNGID